MNQMNIQQAPHLPVEVNLASLEAPSKERTRPNIENRSGLTQTIRLDEPADIYTVTDFHFRHDSLFLGKISAGIQELSTCDSPQPRSF
jgi:hypothetical protein